LRTHLPIVVDVAAVAEQARYSLPVAAAALGAGADGVILRVWMGQPETTCRVPATLAWDEAVQIAGKLRAVGEALRVGGHDGRSI
jgi:3-deoxy-D-arabino-heptulosonate 7-phosphate (DAHP) synthase